MIPVIIDLVKRVEALERIMSHSPWSAPWSAHVPESVGFAQPERLVSTAAIKGTVISNGGGCLSLVVDRDTDDYPPVGSQVVVWEVESEIPTSEWEGVIGFAKYNGAGETLFNQGGNARLNRELVDDGWTPLQARPEA